MPVKQTASELLAVLSNGDFDAQVSADIARAVEAVEAGKGKAKIVITIELSKSKRMVVAKPTVKSTIPNGAVDASMFFVNEKNQLCEEDPLQVTMKFPRQAGKLVKLDGGTTKAADSATDDPDTKKDN